jgi:hypothetical protein
MRDPLGVRFATVFLAVSMLELVACDDAPKTTTMRRVEDPWAFAQAAMASGPLLIVVRGLPSPASDVAVEDAVLQAAQAAVTWTASPRFTVIPARAAPSNLHLIYVFNGRRSPTRAAMKRPAANGSRVGASLSSPRCATGPTCWCGSRAD